MQFEISNYINDLQNIPKDPLTLNLIVTWTVPTVEHKVITNSSLLLSIMYSIVPGEAYKVFIHG